jgi:hypothetical protein
MEDMVPPLHTCKQEVGVMVRRRLHHPTHHTHPSTHPGRDLVGASAGADVAQVFRSCIKTRNIIGHGATLQQIIIAAKDELAKESAHLELAYTNRLHKSGC